MKKTYNVAEAMKAQVNYLKELSTTEAAGWMASAFSEGRGFAPQNGICYSCGRQIYGEGGISVETAGRELTTGCPFCHRSYVD